MDRLQDDDDLTPEELAYIESGGRAALPEQPVQDGGAEKPAADDPAKEAAPTASDEAGAEGEDDEDDGEAFDESKYVRDAQGKLRDPKTNRFVKLVPHHALHSARAQHKKTKAELEKLRIEMARGNERLAILNEAFNGNGSNDGNQEPKQVNPLEESDIDPTKDIFGAFDQLRRRNAFQAEQFNSSNQRSETREAMGVLRNRYIGDVATFKQKTPDFMDAYAHLVNGRLAELKMYGYENAAEIKRIIEQEETQIVARALQGGSSPAEFIYNVAKSRGYVPKTAIDVVQQNSAAEKVRQIEHGQKAAQTLSNVGGQAAPTLTFETLARMTDEEFDAATSGMTAKQIERMLGGR